MKKIKSSYKQNNNYQNNNGSALDSNNNNIEAVGLTTGNALGRAKWRQGICCGDP